MATDLIRYDLLVQDALRGVVQKVLSDAADTGYLPGEHHFTISFRTTAPGVRISKRLAAQWPQEMTIILQHQFSDLFVDDIGFGVTLSFRSIPEQLYIPYPAISGFFDPSVEFGLKFESSEEEDLDEDEDDEAAEPTPLRPANLAKPATAETAAKAEKPAKPEDAEKKPEPAAETGPTKVVSIDAFRKKNT
jgi:uncharacterized protein